MRVPAARSYDEAFGQVSRILNEVEDELSGIEYNFMNAGFDGRMYPPTWDNIRRHPNRAAVYLLLSRGHLTMIGDNGAIKTNKRTADQTLLDKPGEDGRKIDDL
jgi:hypothetical protein